MQYVPESTNEGVGARPALLDILRPVAVLLVAGASAGVWWVAELGRFWA